MKINKIHGLSISLSNSINLNSNNGVNKYVNHRTYQHSTYTIKHPFRYSITMKNQLTVS